MAFSNLPLPPYYGYLFGITGKLHAMNCPNNHCFRNGSATVFHFSTYALFKGFSLEGYG